VKQEFDLWEGGTFLPWDSDDKTMRLLAVRRVATAVTTDRCG